VYIYSTVCKSCRRQYNELMSWLTWQCQWKGAVILYARILLMGPDSFLLRLWRCINYLLTYLLTYLLSWESRQQPTSEMDLESNFGRQMGVQDSACLNESDAVIRLKIMCKSTGCKKHFFNRTNVISWPFAIRIANTRSCNRQQIKWPLSEIIWVGPHDRQYNTL